MKCAIHLILLILLIACASIPDNEDDSKTSATDMTNDESGTIPGGTTSNEGPLFTPPHQSPYILPYPIGKSYTMIQGNYSPPPGGHRNTFAYDFDFNMGDTITAARNGVVLFVNDQYSDNDHISGHENNVFIEHADQTVVRYTHLMQGGARMTVNQSVKAGDLVGLSGNSGASSGPHLHFQVFYNRSSYDADNAVPITFANAIGIRYESGELVEGKQYRAGPVN
ncbi:MAG: M23 family metallopeptidase [Calditrichaeota bacterium]|nr:M23 family metallopeptidase [Calditrichota bacterium]